MQTNHEVLKSVRAQIKEKGLCDTLAPFEACQGGFQEDSMNRRDFIYLSETSFLMPGEKLSPNPLKRFFQGAVIKLLRFYVDPMFEQQTQYNTQNVSVLEQLEKRVAALETCVQALQARLDERALADKKANDKRGDE